MGIDRTGTRKPARDATRAAGASAPKRARGGEPPRLAERKTSALPGYLPEITALEVEALGKKRSAPGVKQAHIVAEVQLGLPTSGLVHLPTGETLAVSDNQGIFEVRPGEKPRLLFKLDDGEGITTDVKGKHVYVVEERERRVRKLEVRHDDKGRVALRDTDQTRKLPKLERIDNKGWEGVAFLPREVAGGRSDFLVCVHEASPRRLGIYALPDLDEGFLLKIPKAAKDLMPDLADVAVDPSTGHLFVVSDQGQVIVELRLDSQRKAASQGLLTHFELKMVSSIALPLSNKRKPEALHFDERGRLWVGLDYENDDKKSGKALVLELDR